MKAIATIPSPIKTGVKKSIPPRDTRDRRDTRRNAKPALKIADRRGGE